MVLFINIARADDLSTSPSASSNMMYGTSMPSGAFGSVMSSVAI
ncbi:MAG: hypothetical protein U5L03_07210 [Burkholderiaceae bacterium]|nr:hypothetical protein [Burkholderiaceae bacterium]